MRSNYLQKHSHKESDFEPLFVLVSSPEISISFVAIKMGCLQKQPTDPATASRKACLLGDRTLGRDGLRAVPFFSFLSELGAGRYRGRPFHYQTKHQQHRPFQRAAR